MKTKAISATESQEQIALFQWAEMALNKYPELRLMYAIPNGGKRHIATAKRLKKEGVKSGVPDVCLAVARGDYHGLYIEMKVKGGKPSINQLDWINRLRIEGYKVDVCYGWEAAIGCIEKYLRGEINA